MAGRFKLGRKHARTIVALAILLTMAMPLSALAHSRDDEIACTPDVMRLCKSAIPSQTRIVACLVQYKRYLSYACAKVFDREETTQSVPASRNERPHPWGPKESWGR